MTTTDAFDAPAIAIAAGNENDFLLDDLWRETTIEAALLGFDGFQAETQGTLQDEALLAELARHR